MKKMICLLLVLVLMLTLFVGCKKDKTGDTTEPNASQNENPEVNDGAKKMTLVVAGTFGDRSFYDSSLEGSKKLKDEGIVALTTIECNGENFENQMHNAAEKADIVVCVGWEFYEIESIAPQYPNVHWIWIDNATMEPVANVLNIVYKQNEGSFLAGYIAAATSKTGVVGAVGGEDSDTINDFIIGFEQGARYYKEETVVLHNYTNDYDDPTKGKECALSLNDQGADVIFQVASAAGAGVFEAAKQRGFYAIGVDSDQKYISPDVIICSMKKSVGDSIYQAVKNDNMWGQTWSVGLADGLVGIGYGDDTMPQQVSDDVKAAVEEIAADICSGAIVVDTTFR